MNKKHHSESFWDKLIQFIKFSLVGVSNTLISEGVYAILLYFRMHYLLASFIGFSLSVVNAYYWNNRYVFVEQDDLEKRVWWKVFCKTYLAYTGGFVLNAVLLVFFMDILKLERFLIQPAAWFIQKGMIKFDAHFLAGILAAFLNLVITVPINFIANKYWAFRQKK